MSSLDRLARANISGVGANLPAKARVIELVSASARLRIKSAKTCQWSRPACTCSRAASVSLDDDEQAVGAQRAEEFLLAAVAGVQRADADARVLGHRGDRRTGVVDEHRPGRIEDPLVVTGRLGLAAAHRAVAPAARGRLGHESECSRDWNKPFRSDIVGTEDFVPVLQREDPMSSAPQDQRQVRRTARYMAADRRWNIGVPARVCGRGRGAMGEWRWVAFGAVITAAVMDLLDSTIAQVAAPTIRRELGGSYAVIEWVTAAYALAMAVGLLTGGRLGDIFGRRRMLLTGMAGFVVASAACAAAGTAGELIAARAAGRAVRGDHAAAGVRPDQGPVRGARDGQGVRRLRAGDGPVGDARADRVGRADQRRPVRHRLADDLRGERARRARGAGARRPDAAR